MFSRHNERPANEDPRFSTTRPPSPAIGMRDVIPVQVAPEPAPVTRVEESIVGREDRVEGTIRTQKNLRILGQLQGRIEAAASVTIEEGAKVDADLTADEAIIAGQYAGKLVCRQRLEIRATGLVKGEIETVRLMLHEGGFIDGELHMQKPEAVKAREAESVRGGTAPRSAAIEIARDTVPSGRTSGSTRSPAG